MDCQRIDAILDQHAIGALSTAERAKVDAHLGQCRRCADAWFSHELLGIDAPAAPRQGLFDEIADRAGTESATMPAVRSTFRRSAWLAGAAAATAAAVLVLWGGSEEGALPESGSETASTQPDADISPVALQAADRRIPDIRFVAGRDYERLPVPAPTASAEGTIEVCEFFMFWCIHCYEFESELDAWSEAQPDYVDLVRVPALFNSTARLQAQAFYTAEALGLIDVMRQPFYEEIHVRGNPLATRQDIRQFFARFGVAEARFDEVFDSFGVQANLRRAEELNRRYRVSATPSLAVNGKYLTNSSMTGSNEAMLEVVDSLVEAEALGLCTGDDVARCPFN